MYEKITPATLPVGSTIAPGAAAAAVNITESTQQVLLPVSHATPQITFLL
jgi:hypothetical protein